MKEHVFVELDWYDGPRVGIANVKGIAHRFSLNFSEEGDEYLDTFQICPINKIDLSYEVEQWKLFVDWNNEYELGKADTSRHPGNGGINKRWDELQTILQKSRESVASSETIARAELFRLEGRNRYEYTGPDYALSWNLL